VNLADVVGRHGPACLQKYGARMPQSHRHALEAILRCHTPAQGGSLYVCDHCGTRRFAWHRCGHRACNQCGYTQGQQWLTEQTARLLPVGYFLVTFTIPSALRAIFRSHQRLCYDLLFAQSARTLQDVARQPRYLRGDLGMLGVLHVDSAVKLSSACSLFNPSRRSARRWLPLLSRRSAVSPAGAAIDRAVPQPDAPAPA